MPDIWFVDGGLRFYCADGRKMSLFENSHGNDGRVSESFRSKDARRFVDAFHTRKASHD
jgi:hypothetical protein